MPFSVAAAHDQNREDGQQKGVETTSSGTAPTDRPYRTIQSVTGHRHSTDGLMVVVSVCRHLKCSRLLFLSTAIEIVALLQLLPVQHDGGAGSAREKVVYGNPLEENVSAI